MPRSRRGAAASCPRLGPLAPHGRPTSWPRACLACGRLLDEGVTTVEIKSGYGLDLASERRMLRAARTLGRNPARAGPDELPRRARVAARGAGRQGRLHRPPLCRGAAGAGRRGAGRCGGRLLRDDRVFARPMRPAVRGRGRARPPGEAACGPVDQRQRCRTRGSPRRALGRPPGICGRGRGPPRWRGPARSRCCCPAPSTSCARRRCRRSSCSAATACRWRSRPTATRAPRR